MSAGFVACMEDVLDLYAEPYDSKRPVVCFDETSKQLASEKREPMSEFPPKLPDWRTEYAPEAGHGTPTEYLGEERQEVCRGSPKLKPRWNPHFRDDEGQAKVLGEGFQPAHKAGPLLPVSLLNMHIPPWH